MRFFRSSDRHSTAVSSSSSSAQPQQFKSRRHFSLRKRSEDQEKPPVNKPAAYSVASTAASSPSRSSSPRISRESSPFEQTDRTSSPGMSASSLSSRTSSSHSMHNTLVDYRQLRCSMSYKNRVNHADTYRETMATSTASTARLSLSRVSTSLGSTSRGSISRASVRSSISDSEARATVSSTSSDSMRMTEANVAALHTRRAFQQMVLAMEDEESGDEYDSDAEFVRSSNSESSGGVVSLAMDDYRKFQYRLRQLEDLCNEQAHKQMQMEDTIEQEVQQRTRKVVEAMEKKIAMYKQAKEVELERELQRRISGLDPTRLSSTPATRGSMRGSMRESVHGNGSFAEKNKPLEKIFHPRRARRRLEMMKEREEQQKREMEQFREFIRTTEANSSRTTDALSDIRREAAGESLNALNDPLLNDKLVAASPADMLEIICVLRSHVSEQDTQLEQAREYLDAALNAKDEAETTAREAVAMTVALDSRLDQVAHELSFLRGRSLSMASVSSDQLSMSARRSPS